MEKRKKEKVTLRRVKKGSMYTHFIPEDDRVVGKLYVDNDFIEEDLSSIVVEVKFSKDAS